MDSAARAYTKEVHNKLEKYATWLPGENVQVGDVGQLQNEVFHRLAHLKDFKIACNVVKDPNSKTTYKCMSSTTRETEVSASAKGPTAGLGAVAGDLHISFSRKDSFYLLLTQCIGSSIDNLIKLGNEILKRVQTRDWQVDYVVVTRVVTAGSATILQASTSGSSVVLQGDESGNPVASLLEAGAAIKSKSDGAFSLSTVAQAKLTPLFNLGKVEYNWHNWFLGDDPTFKGDTGLKGSIGSKQLNDLVDSTPHVEFAGQSKTKNDLMLHVNLPRYGNYLDMSGLADLASVASRPRSSRGRGVGDISFRRVPTRFGAGSFRVDQRRLVSVVKGLRRVDLDQKASTKDYVRLNVQLLKSGATVSMEPVISLTKESAGQRAVATAKAELSFGEIE
jgi:hypothetical protein